MWADALLDLSTALPDSELTESTAAQASTASASLYERAVAAYSSVLACPEGPVRADAAVNAANALCAWAEQAAAAGQAGGLLGRAVELYRVALQQEEDALVGGMSLT